MMNFFVKVTKEQREALEYHKTETGETVGNVVNRLINDFLGDLNDDNLTEEFEETFGYYQENPKSCDTTISAKIPAKSNQKLLDYLGETGGSRNALLSSLVHMELHGQEMTQEQNLTM